MAPTAGDRNEPGGNERVDIPTLRAQSKSANAAPIICDSENPRASPQACKGRSDGARIRYATSPTHRAFEDSAELPDTNRTATTKMRTPVAAVEGAKAISACPTRSADCEDRAPRASNAAPMLGRRRRSRT